ncbi:TPA: hypothetical protein L3709_005974 [Pseudomonas aeruginosa]|nr:hypothetical protein [Pseudomonas aeruginosa]
MSLITLSEFVKPIGQAAAAKKLGSSQASISKALKAGRVVVVSMNSEVDVFSFEIKPFPNGRGGLQARLDLDEVIAQVRLMEDSAGIAVPVPNAQVAP